MLYCLVGTPSDKKICHKQTYFQQKNQFSSIPHKNWLSPWRNDTIVCGGIRLAKLVKKCDLMMWKVLWQTEADMWKRGKVIFMKYIIGVWVGCQSEISTWQICNLANFFKTKFLKSYAQWHWYLDNIVI